MPTETSKLQLNGFQTKDETKSLYKAVKENPKDKIEIELGDSKDSSQLYPQAKIQRWNNEVNFSLRYKEDSSKEAKVVEVKNDVLVWSKGKKEVHIYEKPEVAEDGGLEIEVVLKEKPDTNVIEFTLQTKGLEFFYQPELTQEEKDHGSIRPDNVVGSYAVYYKDCPANYVGGKEYKTGKAFHIFRPKITDANGNEVWGELNVDVDNNLLTITIDQSWLDNAIYPIIIDPTFGYTTAGASFYSDSSGYMYGGKYSAPGTGTVNSISVYSNISGSNQMCGIYDNSNNLVGSSASDSSGSGSKWRTMNASGTISIMSSQNYWLTYWIGASVTMYQDSITNTAMRRSGITYTGTYPSTRNTSGDRTDVKFSIYATYTAGGGASAPTVTTQDCTDVTSSSATGNGNITNTGGENATRRGFCYMAGTTGDPTTADSVVYDDGSFGTGAYTKGITGLSPETGYRVRAYAVNSGGTGYGTTGQLTTSEAVETRMLSLTGVGK